MARAMDVLVNQFGAIGNVDALEVLLGRFTAVLHAECLSCGNEPRASRSLGKAPWCGGDYVNRVKKMARLQGIPSHAMRLGGHGQGVRDEPTPGT